MKHGIIRKLKLFAEKPVNIYTQQKIIKINNSNSDIVAICKHNFN